MAAHLEEMIAKLAAAPALDPSKETAFAAVAAILREVTHVVGPELLFIRRADRSGDPWSGHVAFPGGRRDADDANLLATAMRETREEVGIDLSERDLVARLPDVPAFTRSKPGSSAVAPFVFALKNPNVVITANEEVASTLWVPLTTLAHADNRSQFQLDYEGKTFDLPCIHLEPGAHRLWGLTFRMVEMLFEATA